MRTLELIRRRLHKLWYPGSSWLRSYEAHSLLAFYLSRGDEEKTKLIQQFEKLDKLQRSKNGKLLQLFDCLDSTRQRWPAEIRIEPLKAVAGHKVRFGSGGDQGVAVIFLGNGGIGEIQFTRIPPIWIDKHARVTELARYCRDELENQYPFEYCGEISQEEEEDLNQSIGEG